MKDKKKRLPYVPPHVYQGRQIWIHQESEDDGTSFFYAISGNHYVNNAVANVQKNLMDNDREFSAKQQSHYCNLVRSIVLCMYWYI